MGDFLQRVGIPLPLVQSPMAGGPDTPALAAAVSQRRRARVARLRLFVGGAASRPWSAERAAADAAAVRAQPVRPRRRGPTTRRRASACCRCCANFAASSASPTSRQPRRPRLRFVRGAARGGAARPPARVQLHLRHADATSSWRRCAAQRSLVVGTATTVDEADALAALGVDAICAQGGEAGGHRGTFLGRFEDALDRHDGAGAADRAARARCPSSPPAASSTAQACARRSRSAPRRRSSARRS